MIAVRRLARHVAARLAGLGDGLPLNLSTPAHIESLGRFRLDPGVRVIEAEARTSARFETHFAARLSLPSSHLETFLAGTLVPGPLSADSLPRDLLLRTRGMRSFVAGQAVEGHTTQTIVVDTSDPEQFVVHILTHSR